MSKEAKVIGHNETIQTIIDRFGVHNKPAKIESDERTLITRKRI